MKDWKKALVDYYNEYRSLFEIVPPCFPVPIPEAKMSSDYQEDNSCDVVLFDAKDRLLTKSGETAFMSTSSSLSAEYEDGNRLLCVITVSGAFYNSPQDLDKDLFPLLHEMVHIKEWVLIKNNLSVDYTNFPKVFSKAKKIHSELNPDGSNQDKEEFIFLLYFLSEAILKDENEERKQKLLKVKEIIQPDPVKCLIERLYPCKYCMATKLKPKTK